MNRFAYTKILLQEAGEEISDEHVFRRKFDIWINHRTDSQSFRLSDEGLEFFLGTLKLQSYEIEFPADLDLKPQVLLYLDKFLNSPYYLTNKCITVFTERKMFELTMFSGDVRQYGLAKAMTREYPKAPRRG